jgi:Na+/H+-dicarboxylate symporter/ABC-type amino acid transport substrate-binding protein
MSVESPKTHRIGLSGCIFIGLLLGILCGLFLGEYCADLKVFGNAFIKLLQMSILPYIVVSLIGGIGRLSYGEAKLLAIKAGLLLLLFWGVSLAVVFSMPLAFPEVKTASFFSTSMVEAGEGVDFLELFIPSNPFKSLANTVIPASVLFSVAVGIALIGVKGKQKLIDGFDVLAAALSRVAAFMVYLTPIGVFAIAASAAGTMTLEEIGRLQVYFITFMVGALFLAFWVLPMLVAILTPFSYREVVGISKDALVTAFATGKTFIILPILIENCKQLFDQKTRQQKDADAFVDIIIPISFNFPSTGKLLTLLFLFFCAWFSGRSLTIGEYPHIAFTGVASLFASTDIAIPFLMNSFQIPSDFYQLFLLTGIVNRRFAALLVGMNLLCFTLLGTCLITGLFSPKWKKLLHFALASVVLMTGIVAGTRFLLNYTVTDAYSKDKIIAGMHLLQNPVPAVIHQKLPQALPEIASNQTDLEGIKTRGVLRVGYDADRLPMSFMNSSGELVGLDVELVHRLAKELGVTLEFIPFEHKTLVQRLNQNRFDLAIGGIPMLTSLLEDMRFSDPYLNATVGMVVKDHRRKEFTKAEDVRRMPDLRIAIRDAYSDYYLQKIKERFPQISLIKITSMREFFEQEADELDGLLTSAEAGAAWTLLYPEYEVVVPQPAPKIVPVGFAMAYHSEQLNAFMNRWIEFKKKDKTLEDLYNYWILGMGAVEKKPRWSIIRNVLHWVK